MASHNNFDKWFDLNSQKVTNHDGKTTYAAEIIGLHDEYRFEREFISSSRSSSNSHSEHYIHRDDVQVGNIYEIRVDSWNNTRSSYVLVHDIEITDDGVETETERLSEAEVERYLDSDKDEDRDADRLKTEVVGLIKEIDDEEILAELRKQLQADD